MKIKDASSIDLITNRPRNKVISQVINSEVHFWVMKMQSFSASLFHYAASRSLEAIKRGHRLKLMSEMWHAFKIGHLRFFFEHKMWLGATPTHFLKTIFRSILEVQKPRFKSVWFMASVLWSVERSLKYDDNDRT